MKKRWLLLLPLLGVYLAGMFTDVMQADAAQYATMSLEMLQTGNYLELYHRGQDYIDKPPLIFWTAALSFQLFGPSNFAYKLPSVLFTLLGLFATYRLGKLLYGARVGFYATLLLASCQAWFTINTDVRTDTILAACTIVAIWQLAEFNIHQRTIHIIYAGLAIAGAMLMKGPIGLMVPALAVGTDYALKRQWKMFFRWEWLLLAGVVLVCLLPMLYGLYTQFDASNGKVTYNGTITSGLRFYFWTQSFGRLTGESTWKNDAGQFFFAHTFLWAFLPWSVVFVVAFIKRLKKIAWNRLLIKGGSEALTIGGILFPAIAFSLSQYKLPHYIFVFFPLAAILSGKFLASVINKSSFRIFVTFRITHAIISLLLLALGLFIGAVCFPLYSIPIAVVTILGIFLTIFFIFYKGSPFQMVVLPALIAITTFNFLMNAQVYPQLLIYQAPGQASHLIKSKALEEYPLIGFRSTWFSMDFYYGEAVPNVERIEDLIKTYPGQTLWIFTHEEGYGELRKAGMDTLQQRTLEDFHVSTLTMKFLNPKTRSGAVGKRYLLLVKIPG